MPRKNYAKRILFLFYAKDIEIYYVNSNIPMTSPMTFEPLISKEIYEGSMPLDKCIGSLDIKKIMVMVHRIKGSRIVECVYRLGVSLSIFTKYHYLIISDNSFIKNSSLQLKATHISKDNFQIL